MTPKPRKPRKPLTVLRELARRIRIMEGSVHRPFLRYLVRELRAALKQTKERR